METEASEKIDIVVVGSCNYDMFSYVDKFPRPGETIFGTKFETGFGGDSLKLSTN